MLRPLPSIYLDPREFTVKCFNQLIRPNGVSGMSMSLM